MPIYPQQSPLQKPIKVVKFTRNEKRKNGIKVGWHLRWNVPGQRKNAYRSCGTGDEALAEQMRERLQAELTNGQYKHEKHLSWGEFETRYTDEYLQYCSESTIKARRIMLRSFLRVNQTGGPVDITANHIVGWMDAMRAEESQMSYIAYQFKHMKAMLKWCQSHDIIDKIPSFPMLKNIKTEMRGRPITENEFSQMLARIPEMLPVFDNGPEVVARWEHELRGAWWSSLRVGEIHRLSWDALARFRVDLSGEFPVFHIAADAQKNRKNQITPIAPEFAKWLLSVPEHQRHGKVFKTMAQCSPERLGAKISELGTLAGIIVKVGKGGHVYHASCHDFRRSFAERWAMRLDQPHILMIMMRHEKIETTMQYYVGRNVQMAAASIWDAMQKIQGFQQIGTCAPSTSDQA